MTESVRRSWLIIPATRTDRIEESWTYGADVIVLDLEDMVHDSRKHQAREGIRDAITQARKGGAEVFVRCDLELLYADLEASVWRGLQGLVLPKVNSVAQIREADETLAYFEAERGVRRPALAGVVDEADNPRTAETTLELHLSFENAKGNYEAVELVQASERTLSVSLGRADLVMDLRPLPRGDLVMMPFFMQRLIMAANVAGVVPIGAWWQGNSRGLRASPQDTLDSARLGRSAGFKGALCVEPDQVPALNEGFTPTASEVSEAQALIQAFAVASSQGKPYAEVSGVLVDEARADVAQSIIDWAAACKARDDFKTQAVANARRDGNG